MADQFDGAGNQYPSGSFYADLADRITALEAALGTGPGAVPDGSITTFKLADNSVTGPKIASGAVDVSKLNQTLMHGSRELASTPGTALGDWNNAVNIAPGYGPRLLYSNQGNGPTTPTQQLFLCYVNSEQASPQSFTQYALPASMSGRNMAAYVRQFRLGVWTEWNRIASVADLAGPSLNGLTSASVSGLAGARRITIHMSGMGDGGSNNISTRLRLRTTGGDLSGSGYNGSLSRGATAEAIVGATSIPVFSAAVYTGSYQGRVVLERLTTTLWSIVAQGSTNGWSAPATLTGIYTGGAFVLDGFTVLTLTGAFSASAGFFYTVEY